MKKIRYNVFETNSSSSHSFNVGSSTFSYENETLLSQIEDGQLVLEGGQFGWEYEVFNDSLTKANYCAVSLEYKHNCVYYQNGSYKLDIKERSSELNDEIRSIFEQVLKRETDCVSIKYDFNTDWGSENWAYIDHQSNELLYDELYTNNCINDDLTINETNTDKFFVNLIFNSNSEIETGNDNS
jgi:hypothetical protein